MSTDSGGISRRSALKRGAAIGGGLVWAVPTIQTVGMTSAFAQSTSPVPDTCCVDWFTGTWDTTVFNGGIACDVTNSIVQGSYAFPTVSPQATVNAVIAAILNCGADDWVLTRLTVSGDNIISADSGPVSFPVVSGDHFAFGLPTVDPNLPGHLILVVEIECRTGVETRTLEVDFDCGIV